MLETAVIPVAGKGTRLLPFTKELPKEMLPLYHQNGMKPVVQIVFEQLYDAGVRNFIFIVGRGKRAIEDHFTPDRNYFKSLNGTGKEHFVEMMESFYSKIDKSNIAWINQSFPKGFGDAVLKARPYVGMEPFLVHAGDTCIIGEEKESTIMRISTTFKNKKVNCVLATMNVPDREQLKHYGVVTLDKDHTNMVIKIVEKPQVPESSFAVMPIYAFDHSIFESLMTVTPGIGNEIQLTDGISDMIKGGKRVFSCSIEKDLRFDVGTPESYIEALSASFEITRRKSRT